MTAMTANLNHAGADEAATIRTTAAQLAKIPDLRHSSSMREILLDLSHALADLAEPITVLVDEWTETAPAVDRDELPDTDALVDLAGRLRYCADNT